MYWTDLLWDPHTDLLVCHGALLSTLLHTDWPAARVTNLLHGGVTLLDYHFSRLKPTLLLLFTGTDLSRQLDVDVNTDLLQFYLLHLDVTFNLWHHPGHLLAHLLEHHHLHLGAHITGGLHHVVVALRPGGEGGGNHRAGLLHCTGLQDVALLSE